MTTTRRIDVGQIILVSSSLSVRLEVLATLQGAARSASFFNITYLPKIKYVQQVSIDRGRVDALIVSLLEEDRDIGEESLLRGGISTAKSAFGGETVALLNSRNIPIILLVPNSPIGGQLGNFKPDWCHLVRRDEISKKLKQIVDCGYSQDDSKQEAGIIFECDSPNKTNEDNEDSFQTPSLTVVPPVDDRIYDSDQGLTHKPLILLVEDCADNRELLGLMLSGSNLELTYAQDGQDAMMEVWLREPDLILMDLQLPSMDGIAATKKLRSSGYSGPIIAVTAELSQEKLIECRSAGCDEILRKPFSSAELRSVVERYLVRETDSQAEVGSDYESRHLSWHPEYRELRRRYVESLPSKIEEISIAYLNDEADEVTRLAHVLRTAGLFGLAEISELSARLEKAAKPCGGSPLITSLIMLLKEEVDDLCRIKDEIQDGSRRER